MTTKERLGELKEIVIMLPLEREADEEEEEAEWAQDLISQLLIKKKKCQPRNDVDLSIYIPTILKETKMWRYHKSLKHEDEI